MASRRWLSYRNTAAVLVGLCVVAGGMWGLLGTRDGVQAEPLVIANGTVVAESLRVDHALPGASDRVGFEVRVPSEVPVHLQLRTIRTDVGGATGDQDGTEGVPPGSRTAFLLYEDGKGQHISISQSPPERSTKLAAGSNPREIEVGDTTVTVMVSHHGPDRVSMAWDSPNATYSAIYVFPPEVLSQDEAEQVLLGMLGSMR